MTREDIIRMARKAELAYGPDEKPLESVLCFAELVAALEREECVKECIDKIETHRIPVGNSAAGELACEWTYAALKEIRDEIKEHFGVIEAKKEKNT